jgi:hypothetical protein
VISQVKSPQQVTSEHKNFFKNPKFFQKVLAKADHTVHNVLMVLVHFARLRFGIKEESLPEKESSLNGDVDTDFARLG